MAIELEFYKGKDPSSIEDEFNVAHPNEKLYGDKFYTFMNEEMKFSSHGKLIMHKNNWRNLFQEYPWVTLRLEEILLNAKIKEFSDYPIEYRCGRACLSITTDELLNFYDRANSSIKNEYSIIDGEDIVWDRDLLSHIKNNMHLELWEAVAIYKMMKNLDKIKDE